MAQAYQIDQPDRSRNSSRT